MPNENNLLPEHAQLAAVLDNPDAIQRIKEPTEKVHVLRSGHLGTVIFNFQFSFFNY